MEEGRGVFTLDESVSRRTWRGWLMRRCQAYTRHGYAQESKRTKHSTRIWMILKVTSTLSNGEHSLAVDLVPVLRRT